MKLNYYIYTIILSRIVTIFFKEPTFWPLVTAQNVSLFQKANIRYSDAKNLFHCAHIIIVKTKELNMTFELFAFFQ